MARIAVVDDDQDLQDLIRVILEEREHEMLPVRDGVTAFQRLRDEQPDGVLLDLRLPGPLSGWDILRQLNADATTRAIPVILWSADSHHLAERPDWLAGREVPVLTKPFDIEDLLVLVERALAQRRDVRALAHAEHSMSK